MVEKFSQERASRSAQRRRARGEKKYCQECAILRICTAKTTRRKRRDSPWPSGSPNGERWSGNHFRLVPLQCNFKELVIFGKIFSTTTRVRDFDRMNRMNRIQKKRTVRSLSCKSCSSCQKGLFGFLALGCEEGATQGPCPHCLLYSERVAARDSKTSGLSHGRIRILLREGRAPRVPNIRASQRSALP